MKAISDCHDRTIVGWRPFPSGIAGVPAVAHAEAVRARKIDGTSPPMVLRSGDGLFVREEPLVAVARRYGLTQEHSDGVMRNMGMP